VQTTQDFPMMDDEATFINKSVRSKCSLKLNFFPFCRGKLYCKFQILPLWTFFVLSHSIKDQQTVHPFQEFGYFKNCGKNTKTE
jgi:hypothetical protein